MKKYKYKGYEILSNGTIISPFGNVLTWYDDKFVKLNLDGKVKKRNGLNVLYEVYYGVPVTRTHLVCYKNPNSNAKTKSNLILIPKGGERHDQRIISDEKAEQIKEEYGLSEKERKAIKSSVNHPTISQRGLAKKYGVSINTIQRIVHGTYIKVPRQAVQ